MSIKYDTKKEIDHERKVLTNIANKVQNEPELLIGFFSDHGEPFSFNYYYLAKPVVVKGFLGMNRRKKQVLIAMSGFNIHELGCTVLDKSLLDVTREEMQKYATKDNRTLKLLEDYDPLVI